jgi:integrase
MHKRPLLKNFHGAKALQVEGAAMAKLYKRKKKLKGKEKIYYIVRFKDGNGNQRDKQFTRRYEAEAFIQEISQLITEGHFTKNAEIPLSDLAKRFLEASQVGRNGRSPITRKTAASYKLYLDRHVLPRIGEVPIIGIDRPKLNQLIQELISTLSKRASARQAFAVVKVCLTYAVEMGYLQSNPALSIVVRDDPSELIDKTGNQNNEDRIPVPTRAEVTKILETAKSRRDDHSHKQVREAWKRYYPMFMLLAMTGVRSSEMRALRWGDVDWEDRLIRIRRSADADTCEIIPLKSKNSLRDIPLPGILYQELQNIRVEGNELIFGGVKSKKPPTHSSISYYNWHPLLEEAGVRRYGMHSLRNYYATQLLSSNVDLLSVKKWLGHHSASFTIDRYGHYMPDTAARQIKKVKF